MLIRRCESLEPLSAFGYPSSVRLFQQLAAFFGPESRVGAEYIHLQDAILLSTGILTFTSLARRTVRLLPIAYAVFDLHHPLNVKLTFGIQIPLVLIWYMHATTC